MRPRSSAVPADPTAASTAARSGPVRLPQQVPDQPTDDGSATAPVGQWSVTQAAAVTAAEAIATAAAAEVAAEAAATAQAAVTVAVAAASKAAAKARDVAADAVVAAAAAAAATRPVPSPGANGHAIDRAAPATAGVFVPPGDGAPEAPGSAGHQAMVNAATAAATAASKVALSVTTVAAATATAAVEAATLVGDQLAKDVAATAVAVGAAAAHPGLAANPGTLPPSDHDTRADHADLVPRAPDPAIGRGEVLLAERLRRGIDANQLRLAYQPIMNLATGQPVGVEALVRWQHPDLGLLGPLGFIDTAERTGLALPLGAWVLDEACRVAACLPTRGDQPLTVAVNLSAHQLSDRGLVAAVRGALDAHGCRADRLILEVTETAMVTDMAAAIDSLRELQSLGAAVAIDDFGTGYSTLLYLQHLPANTLKIDRSFVTGLGGTSRDTAIVASLITLAHNLGIRCVAEGVETATQLTALEQLGCDFAQGYLFSRPVDHDTLNTWLDQQPTPPTRRRPPATPSSPEEARTVAMDHDDADAHTIAAALNADRSQTPHSRD